MFVDLIAKCARVSAFLGLVSLGGMVTADAAELEIWTARDAQLGSIPIIASKKDFLAGKGVDAEVKFVSSGNAIPVGMAGGTIPMAVASYTNAIAMIANGVPVSMLAQTADISAVLQLTVRDGANIKTAKNLEGKRLGMSVSPLQTSLLQKTCEAYGCDPAKITVVNMQPEDLVIAFQRGDLDAVQTNDPWSVYMQREGGSMLLSAAQSKIPGMEGERRIMGVYIAAFARPDWVEQNPAMAEGVLAAFLDAKDWIKANPVEAAEIVGQAIDIPADIVIETFKKVDFTMTMTSEWGQELNQQADLLYKSGELATQVTADKAFNPEPLKKICPECVTFTPNQ